ncbi:MAG: hypothetical protein ACOCXM_08260 [Myxococcota bacterium]
MPRGAEPSDPEACGLCVEPHARLPSPWKLSGSRLLRTEAVPGGLLLLDSYGGRTFASVTTTDGDVIPLAELPYDDPPPLDSMINGFPRAVAVPGTTQVWIVSISFETFLSDDGDGVHEERTDVALYDYGSGEWERVAVGHFDAVAAEDLVALTSGDLVVNTIDNDGLMRARPLGDGEVDLLWQPVEEMSLPDLGGVPWMFLWIVRLEADDVAVIAGDSRETVVGLLDSELMVVSPWEQVGAQWGDPSFVPGESPRADRLVQILPSERTLLLAHGTLAESDAASWQHRFATWMSADGVLEQTPPGILVNPNDYLLATEVHPGRDPIRSARIFGLPNDHAGILWNDLVAGGINGFIHAQVIDADGSLMFSEPQLYDIDGAMAFGQWAQDGRGNAYLVDFQGDEAMVHGVAEDLSFNWTSPLQRCANRLDSVNSHPTGAWDEGLWITWEALHIEESTGQPVWALRTVLLDPDGNPVW